MSLENFKPNVEFFEELREGFLKTNNSFPQKKNYLWIYCDMCGHRVNVYELVNGLWLCPKCRTIINNIEKRLTAVHCDICNNRLTYCKSKTHHWWECPKCLMITEKQKLK